MTLTAAALVDQVEELLASMVGPTVATAERAAVDFDAFASVASNPLHERLATIIADEIRIRSDQREHRRAAMQRFRL
ncbi:hypothetical protein [Methylobacterium sp. E-045]|uniref:hypothetical protein n=1 Tax=Methylobacterium sp. E-045 TaxID=2836575 RepID=UPI001FBA1467|nr:hypothetical protein [Methylobacterium sp. E-045]MCJ2129232.1 hypothetical protein [Methylobacterium sp. E-045]